MFTYAILAVLARDEALVTNAVVPVIRVDTLPVLTDSLLLAFVRFTAFVRVFIALLAWWAFALERPHRVHALAALA